MWPSMFYVVDFDEAPVHKPALVELCHRLQRDAKAQAWKAGGRSKKSLFESQDDFFQQPEAAALLQFCGMAIASIFQKDVSFPESWCHVTNDGGYHDAHAHPNFTIGGVCGIYYIQCSECTSEPPNGINRFYSPSVFEAQDVADIQPTEGQLILFPGNVRHAALPYRGKEDRIRIAPF